jgi:L-alanine-DL-glutamate epimerase-like enolase superfamily enzyme
LAGAVQLVAGLQGLGIEWLEEPFPYVAGVTAPCPWECEDLDAWGIEQYRQLRAKTDIAIAGAEGFRNYSPLSRLLAAGTLDVVQPDTGHLGLLAMLGAAELAAQNGVTFTPHVCCDAVALVVSLHLNVLTGNPVPQEYERFASPLVQQLFVGQRGWLRRDGTVAAPSGPGLGAVLDEETCTRYCVASHEVTT